MRGESAVLHSHGSLSAIISNYPKRDLCQRIRRSSSGLVLRLSAHAAVQQKFALGTRPLPPAALQRFLRWWGQLHGLITLEVFGHLSWVSEDASEVYRAVVLQQADEIEALAADVN